MQAAPQTVRDGLKKMQELVGGRVSPPPIAQLLGIHFADVGPDRAVMTMEVRPDMLNPMGTLHGGILCDLGDASMGCAAATTLDANESYTTIELRVNYFKPIRSGTLEARSTVARTTRSLVYIECEIVDTRGSVVAKLSSTCMVLRGSAAQGR